MSSKRQPPVLPPFTCVRIDISVRSSGGVDGQTDVGAHGCGVKSCESDARWAVWYEDAMVLKCGPHFAKDFEEAARTAPSPWAFELLTPPDERAGDAG